jgi:NADPH-dependent ferric siderophore reductase
VSLTYIEGDMFFDDPNPPLPHDAIRVLFAGDASSLPALREMLASLPICARGQVFVEVGSGAEVEELASPGRVTVTWLARDRRSGAPGSGRSCAPGEALDRAVRAWLAEMYVDAADLAAGEHLIWIGGPASFAYDLRHDLRAVHAADHGAAATL